MLEKFIEFNPKPQNVTELKVALEAIWNDLPHDSIGKSVLLFGKRLKACVKAEGGHFEHSFK